MNLICFLFGHKSKQYLQVTESDPKGYWTDEDNPGMLITKIISTFFLCRRCYQRYKQNETFMKKSNEEN